LIVCFSDAAGFYLHSFRRHQQSLILPVICQSETFNIKPDRCPANKTGRRFMEMITLRRRSVKQIRV
jgi:hypothetical protein